MPSLLFAPPLSSISSLHSTVFPYPKRRLRELGATSKALYRPLLWLVAHAMKPSPPLTTRIWRGDCPADIIAAGSAIASGALVAFPTETVYGLGADARNDAAVAAIFAAKRRPADNPLIVHVPSKEALERANLTPIPLSPLAHLVTAEFWPGPLTVVLPSGEGSPVSRLVTAGLDSVAVRVPSHPIARDVLEAAGVPVAAPSANTSGRPSPTSHTHVMADLKGRIEGVVDNSWISNEESNRTDQSTFHCGVESTVVDLTDETQPTILRPGAVSMTELERVTGVEFRLHSPTVAHKKSGSGVEQADARSGGSGGSNRTSLDEETIPSLSVASPIVGRGPKAPGMKYRHYAPRAPVVLCSLQNVGSELCKQRRMHPGEAIGLLADVETCAEVEGQEGSKASDDDCFGEGRIVCAACGVRGDPASVGRSLYASLRAFDGEGSLPIPAGGVKVIVAVQLEHANDGIAAAVMNRLQKAASAKSEST